MSVHRRKLRDRQTVGPFVGAMASAIARTTLIGNAMSRHSTRNCGVAGASAICTCSMQEKSPLRTSRGSGGRSTQSRIAAKTLRMYADLWDRHVLPRLGSLELRRITPEVVENFQSDLRKSGVGDPTILKTLSLLRVS